jgi:phosphate acyltransferase
VLSEDASEDFEYTGYVEGGRLFGGGIDVVVTDGFTGNVALKTAEGTARVYSTMLRRAFEGGPASRIGYLLARRSINNLRSRMDPRRYNGAMLLGLNGIVVKSHGGTDGVGFANAIGVAYDLVARGFQSKIRDDFERLKGTQEPDQSAAAI